MAERGLPSPRPALPEPGAGRRPRRPRPRAARTHDDSAWSASSSIVREHSHARRGGGGGQLPTPSVLARVLELHTIAPERGEREPPRTTGSPADHGPTLRLPWHPRPLAGPAAGRP